VPRRSSPEPTASGGGKTALRFDPDEWSRWSLFDHPFYQRSASRLTERPCDPRSERREVPRSAPFFVNLTVDSNGSPRETPSLRRMPSTATENVCSDGLRKVVPRQNKWKDRYGFARQDIRPREGRQEQLSPGGDLIVAAQRSDTGRSVRLDQMRRAPSIGHQKPRPRQVFNALTNQHRHQHFSTLGLQHRIRPSISRALATRHSGLQNGGTQGGSCQMVQDAT
jgi:hypothetical protein